MCINKLRVIANESHIFFCGPTETALQTYHPVFTAESFIIYTLQKKKT